MGNGLAVQECSIAGQSEKAEDKFFFVGVPEFDPTFADAARTSAGLAIKTASRLEGLLDKLDQYLPLIESCAPRKLSQKTWHKKNSHNEKHSQSLKASIYKSSNVDAATLSMIEQLRVGGLADVIA